MEISAYRKCLLFAVVTALLYSHALAENTDEGKRVFSSCVSCHGEHGEGSAKSGAPRLAGQHQWYLLRQITNFRSGIRGDLAEDSFGANMRKLEHKFAEAKNIESLVAYISTLKAPESSPTLEGNIRRGKKLYKSCRTCHGENGEGKRSHNTPRLNEQYDWYMSRQLTNFKRGLRGKHPEDKIGRLMRVMAQRLKNEQAVNDVVVYIKTLD